MSRFESPFLIGLFALEIEFFRKTRFLFPERQIYFFCSGNGLRIS